MLFKNIMQYVWFKLISENDNKHELNQNSDINSREKIKSGSNKKRRLNIK